MVGNWKWVNLTFALVPVLSETWTEEYLIGDLVPQSDLE